MKPHCTVIGMLESGVSSLNETAKMTLKEADLVIGSTRLLALAGGFLAPTQPTFDLTKKLKEVVPLVQKSWQENLNVAVLASGDPLFYGIGAYLQKQLGLEQVSVLAQVSSVQLACNRLGWPPQEVKVCSVHARDLGEWDPDSPGVQGLADLLTQIHHHQKLAILTSPSNSPARIARMLERENVENQFEWTVFEALGGKTERSYPGLSAAQVATNGFCEPNLLMLNRIKPRETYPKLGREDPAYQQRKPDKGLITKREVRLLSLGLLSVSSTDVIWDIGTGSGAVGIEAAALCPFGQVFGVEKNLADFEIAQKNKKQFAVHNLHLTHAKAPEGMLTWPSPNGVFIGGSGGNLELLLQSCWKKLLPGGRLVINLISLENQALAIQWFKQEEVAWDLVQVQVARAKPILDMFRLAAENPVSILHATKPLDE